MLDHIITNSFVKTSIIKSDVPDQFPHCIYIPLTNFFTKNEVIKTINNDEKIEVFLRNLYQ